MTIRDEVQFPNQQLKAGRGELRVELVQGQSAAVSVRAASPFKILVPRSRGTTVWAYLGSFGGGLVAGDEISLDLYIGENARCYLSSQASTKVYRNPDALPCGQSLQAKLGPKALLVCHPEPVQAFRDSCYHQSQRFHIEADSGLVLVDWFTSGRTARGERWEFSRYESRNEIFISGKRVMLDSLLLDSEDGPLAGKYRMGECNCLALVVVIGKMLETQAKGLLKNITDRPAVNGGSLMVTASPLSSSGVLLRIAGASVEEVRTELNLLLDFLPALLEDDPNIRRW